MCRNDDGEGPDLAIDNHGDPSDAKGWIKAIPKLLKLTKKALRDLEVEAEISDRKLVEAVKCFRKDLYCLNLDFKTPPSKSRSTSVDEEGPSLVKRIAYLSYWYARLQPLYNAFPEKFKSKDCTFPPEREITYINVLVSVLIGIMLLEIDLSDNVRANCQIYRNGECDGVKCYLDYVSWFLNLNGGKHFKYFIHALNYNDLTPLAYNMFFKSLVAGGCYGRGSHRPDANESA
jgi:hypothetical protein